MSPTSRIFTNLKFIMDVQINDEKLLRLLSKSFKENITIIVRRIAFTGSMLII